MEYSCHALPLKDLPLYSSIVQDYLQGQLPPEIAWPQYESLADQNRLFHQHQRSAETRAILVQRLQQQYLDAGIEDAAIHGQIEKLLNPKTFTITTGQQIVLATGPLYFPLKIASAIATAKAISALHPEKNIIPVFWMASEDHDFEEIASFRTQENKYYWQAASGGPVGRMPTHGIQELFQTIGKGEISASWRQLLSEAYQSSTLAQATRLLVHALFGQYGLIVIDGDDRELKKLFMPLALKDIASQVSYHAIQAHGQYWEGKYPQQITPRPVNFFIQTHAQRSRLMRDPAGNFLWDESTKPLSFQALADMLQEQPEMLSPNVAMRPLYQQSILPNIGYVGGGAEVSYWLQLKQVFVQHQLPLPALWLRPSVAILSAKASHALQKWPLPLPTLFDEPWKTERALAEHSAPFDLHLQALKTEWTAQTNTMAKEVTEIHPSLGLSAKALQKRTLKALDSFSEKLIRFEKRRQAEKIQQWRSIRDGLQPNGQWQERILNLGAFTHSLSHQQWIAQWINDGNALEPRFLMYYAIV